MDIGPVSAIRHVSLVRPSPPGFGNASGADLDLAGVFASEFRNQRDDSYSPSKASRGLEDEEAAEESEPLPNLSSESAISFFA